MSSICTICNTPTDKTGRHYGAVSCYPCRAFFRRAQVRNKYMRVVHCRVSIRQGPLIAISWTNLLLATRSFILYFQNRKRELNKHKSISSTCETGKPCPTCRYERCLRSGPIVIITLITQRRLIQSRNEAWSRAVGGRDQGKVQILPDVWPLFLSHPGSLSRHGQRRIQVRKQ